MHRQRLDLDRSKVNPDAQAWATAESDQRIGCPFVLLVMAQLWHGCQQVEDVCTQNGGRFMACHEQDIQMPKHLLITQSLTLLIVCLQDQPHYIAGLLV